MNSYHTQFVSSDKQYRSLFQLTLSSLFRLACRARYQSAGAKAVAWEVLLDCHQPSSILLQFLDALLLKI